MSIKKQLIEIIERCGDEKKLALLYQYAAGLLNARPEKKQRRKK